MTDLASGERIGLAAIEVTSVPHLSILQKRFSADADIDAEYKQDMARLLSEVFQCHKNAPCACQDISIEILWTTQEAKGQPYRASIKLHIVIRAIGDSDADADIGSAIETLAGTFKATLDFGKYEYRDIPYGELASRVRKIDGRSVRAVVKSERLEALQSAVMPHCFSFERMPATENDLSRLVGSLIDHPDCAVSLQLMPTAYSASEAAAVGASAQTLGTLARGIMEHGVGHVGFALAERHAETYKYYSRGKDTALFAFNILVIGAPGAADAVATRILAQLNSGSELRIVPLSPDDVRKDDNFFPLPWAAREAILATDRSPAIWGAGQSLGAFYNLPYIITAEEASEFFRLPVGSDAVHAGLSVNESGKASRTYADNLVGGGDVAVGALKSSHRGDAVGISLKDLAKHMLVVGTPGSGKTTFSVGLLDRLWKDHRIPFLVIEPAKSEYRALVRSIPDLQVFTPGKNFISPFIFNPFLPPKNVRLETYKSTLKTAFAAAVSMSSPLDKIFEEAVNNCYSDFRWLDTYTSDDKGRVFNIADFIKCFGETFDAIGYTGDARNIGRAGLVRLQSLANLFDNYSSIPIEDLLTRPTVIELAAIENGDQKALIVSLLLLSVLAYVNGNYLGEGGLRNVILLEEAHVLLDAAGRPGEGEADPSAIAQGLLKRMLAEIRSYGVGVVIADQSPRKVTADVIALTDIKLAFRLVEATDRQILADSSNMSEAQKQRLSRLRPGEAFLFFGRLDEPEEIRTEDYRQVNGIGITLSDEAIGALSMYWKGRADMLRPYPECSHCRGCAGGCDYGRRTLGREVARRIFVKNFGPASSDPGQVRTVFRQMEPLIRQELNDEPFDRALFACAELHLMRRIRYGTRIGISDATVETTLSNI
jgi:hypothetical protein